jgi:putative glutamine amidotransferase
MPSKKPLIGITLSEAEGSRRQRWPVRKGFDYIKHEYYEAILKSGGMPLLFPNLKNQTEIESSSEMIQGLLVTGGVDIHPRYFNRRPHKKLSRTTKARDNFEIKMIKLAHGKGKPILGICRGHQVLNVALGGDLYQDLSAVPGKTIRHADPGQTGKVYHKVKIAGNSMLYEIIGQEVIEVNSSHHQVVNRPGKKLRPVAYSPDGIIEALEDEEGRFILGIQWHPEGIFSRSHSRRLFEYFTHISARNI